MTTKKEPEDTPNEPATKAELKEATPVAFSSPLDAERAAAAAKAYDAELAELAKNPRTYVDAASGLEKRDYRGPDWAGIPNFYCPNCSHATTEGNDAIHEHRIGAHAAALQAEA